MLVVEGTRRLVLQKGAVCCVLKVYGAGVHNTCCDLHSYLRVVVAELHDYSTESPKILQSTPLLYTICAVTVPECLSQVVLYGLAQTLESEIFLTSRS